MKSAKTPDPKKVQHVKKGEVCATPRKHQAPVDMEVTDPRDISMPPFTGRHVVHVPRMLEDYWQSIPPSSPAHSSVADWRQRLADLCTRNSRLVEATQLITETTCQIDEHRQMLRLLRRSQLLTLETIARTSSQRVDASVTRLLQIHSSAHYTRPDVASTATTVKHLVKDMIDIVVREVDEERGDEDIMLVKEIKKMCIKENKVVVKETPIVTIREPIVNDEPMDVDKEDEREDSTPTPSVQELPAEKSPMKKLIEKPVENVPEKPIMKSAEKLLLQRRVDKPSQIHSQLPTTIEVPLQRPHAHTQQPCLERESSFSSMSSLGPSESVSQVGRQRRESEQRIVKPQAEGKPTMANGVNKLVEYTQSSQDTIVSAVE